MSRKLLVQYFYHPFTSNQSFRYEQIIKKKPLNISNIDILTSLHHGLKSEDTHINGRIYRVNSKFLMKKITNNSAQEKERKNSRINKVIKKIVLNLMWPDFAMLWIPHAIKKGINLLKNEKYDTIITGSFPFSSHLVGYFLKKRFPNITWVVDYIDPFSIIDSRSNPANNTILYSKLNFFVENKVNKLADKIIIQPEARESYNLYYSEFKNKTIESKPMLGIDRDLVNSIMPKDINKQRINIFFVGSLYRNIRNPEGVLKNFEKLLKIFDGFHLHFVGDTKDCAGILEEYKLYKKIPMTIYGKVSREDAVSYMKAADILLNISNESDVQLPGKVVEYLYFNKKIINYATTPDNNTIKFFNNYAAKGSVLNIINTENPIELKKFIALKLEVKNTSLSDFFPENISNIYF